MDTADFARLLKNLLCIGTLAEVRHSTPPAALVQTGGTTTARRPWVERRTDKTRTWNPLTEGEQVLPFCPSGDPSNVIILCVTSYKHTAGLLTVQDVKRSSWKPGRTC